MYELELDGKCFQNFNVKILFSFLKGCIEEIGYVNTKRLERLRLVETSQQTNHMILLPYRI